MNQRAEEFRFITMKVLTMQLNSIIIMDVFAYGGSALGIILAISEVMKGQLAPWNAFAIILLAADFFLPMRALGSYFHVAMNGMAASDKLFAILRLPEDPDGTLELSKETAQTEKGLSIVAKDLCFSYDGDRDALNHLSLTIPQGKVTAIVGESGCGKSTLAALLAGLQKGYAGSLTIDGLEVGSLKRKSLYDHVTLVGSSSYIFSGTVRDNLLMGKPSATEEEMVSALQTAGLWDWLKTQKGLDTPIETEATNLSGGQKQRIALARALLHDTPLYVFDEATSSIDVESEQDILKAIYGFRGKKTVLLITHRLENAVKADQIYVMEKGKTYGTGTHDLLLGVNTRYQALYRSQETYEQYARKGANL